jgi:hypothetical protein
MGSLALMVSLLLSQTVPAEPQRPGDPRRGYDVLVNGSYIRCGIPWSLYWEGFGTTPSGWRLDGRRGRNADLPYFMTAAKGRSGTTVVAANCLSCHAGWMDGQLVVGLAKPTSIKRCASRRWGTGRACCSPPPAKGES